MDKQDKNIAFALYIHPSKDERVYYQEAEILRESGFVVSIVSILDAKEKLNSVRQKISYLATEVTKTNADIIISDTPLSVFSAWRVKRRSSKSVKICYDITEWYPSVKNLSHVPFYRKPIRFLLLLFASFLAGILADAFIFGEEDKARPFQLFFGKRRSVMLPYYASKKYMDAKFECPQEKNALTMMYSGSLAKDKGIEKVIAVAEKCAEMRPEKEFVLKVMSGADLHYYSHRNNLKIDCIGYQAYPEFCKTLKVADIFFDLRKIDSETTRCMPIKLFYYMACGRPVVYSNLKAIRKGVPEIDSFAILVNPVNVDDVAVRVLNLIEDVTEYNACCSAAFRLFDSKYNWESVSGRLVELVNRL